MTIVANSRSRYGGKCQDPDHVGPNIAKGDAIFKIGTKGKTTPSGQGPGYWVCHICAYRHDSN